MTISSTWSTHPLETAGGGVGIGGGKIGPERVAFSGKLAHICRNEVVLGTEVPIERHFVGVSGFGNGLNAHGMHAVPVKQVACNGQDPLTRRWQRADCALGCACWLNQLVGHPLLTVLLPIGT